jgi:hypothetical protein
VRAAVDAGEVHAPRFDSYRRMMQGEEEDGA